MQTDLMVQGDGQHGRIASIVGAPFAYEAVNDSSDTTHNSDTDYIVLAGVHRLLATDSDVATNDGDTTFKSFAQGVPQDFSHVATTGILPSGSTIAGLRATWVAKRGAAGDVGRPGIKIGGVRYFGDSFVFDVGGYQVLSFDWLVDPSDGKSWTVAKIEALQSTVQFDLVLGAAPRLTMIALDILPPSDGLVSFPLFLMSERMIPESIVLRVGAKLHSGSPSLRVGFNKGGVQAYSGSAFAPTSSYTVTMRTFATNPLTAAAWTTADLVGLEACVNSPISGGSSRLTLVSGQATYGEAHNYDDETHGAVLA